MKKTISVAVACALLLSCGAPVKSQQPTQSPATAESARPQNSPSADEEVVRITTNLVQLDVVVTDKQGRQVVDLTPEDFEIREDGRAQTISNFSYISTAGPAAPAQTATAAAAVAPPAPREYKAPARPVRLTPRDVRRTIVLLVDDLGLSFESTARIKPKLHEFIDTQLQPNDLVAIIRTGGDVGALQQFTTDRRQLHRSIESVRWNACSRQGLFALSPSTLDIFAPSPRSDGRVEPRPIPSAGYSLCSSTALLATMNAIRFVLQGMRELPGRKSMIIISDNVPIEDQRSQNNTFAVVPQGAGQSAAAASEIAVTGSSSVAAPLRRIAELAIRASVVIYGIDTRGLPDVAVSSLPGNSAIGSDSSMSPRQRSERFNMPRNETDSGREVAGSLARQTGGRLIYNTNDIAGGLRRVMEEQKGYYLIGYRPGGETFDRRFHRISVRVKRPGLTARTRTGFYGVTDEDARPAPPSVRDQTLTALMSPFGAGAISLRLTPLFANLPETGSLLRSLVHVNARDLAFSDEPDGAHTANIEVTGVIFNDNGGVAGQHRRTHKLTIRGQAYERVLAEGFSLVFNMPIKRAGAYQFRVAVRDTLSARIGAAGQFVEVPDLGNERLALSGIALAGASAAAGASVAAGAEKAAALRPAPGSDAVAVAAVVAAPEPAHAVNADPAVRRFSPGTSLEYDLFVYNARADKATNRPHLTVQAQLFHDGRQVHESVAAPLELGQLTDPKRAPARGRLALDGNLPPGEYALQLVVTDTVATGKHRTATQWIDFEIARR